MLRMKNKYCSNCLSTQRFLDLGTCLVCEHCSKRLERIDKAADRHGAPAAGRLVAAWADHAERHREAI